LAKKDAVVQLNLFVNDVDAWRPKSDRAALEHPFYSLSKKKDIKTRRYTSPDGKVTIEVTPSSKGAATIYDKDIVIYAISVVRNAMRKWRKDPRDRAGKGDLQWEDIVEEPVATGFEGVGVLAKTVIPTEDSVEEKPETVKSRPINLVASNLLKSIKRGTGGKDYKDLEDALDRLQDTRIKTNHPVGNGLVVQDSFRIIEKVRIIKDEATGRMLSIQLILSDWLWTAAVERDNDLLEIDPEYFSITSATERRLYEICRKHCGHQPSWNIFMENLYTKSGSSASYKEFRRMVREIVEKNTMPRYSLSFDAKADKFWVRNRIALEAAASLGIAK